MEALNVEPGVPVYNLIIEVGEDRVSDVIIGLAGGRISYDEFLGLVKKFGLVGEKIVTDNGVLLDGRNESLEIRTASLNFEYSNGLSLLGYEYKETSRLIPIHVHLENGKIVDIHRDGVLLRISPV